MCNVQDCEQPAARSGLCWSHVKRRQRGTRVGGLLRERDRDPWELALEAAFGFFDIQATDKEAWKRARERFRWALRVYSESRIERAMKRFLRHLGRIERELESMKFKTRKADRDERRKGAMKKMLNVKRLVQEADRRSEMAQAEAKYVANVARAMGTATALLSGGVAGHVLATMVGSYLVDTEHPADEFWKDVTTLAGQMREAKKKAESPIVTQ